jgi:hypothetical protein
MNESKSVVKELKEKYQVGDILKKRYNNDIEILDFYDKYYNDLDEVEYKNNMIWRLFRSMWMNEKQEIILEILSLILMLEKQLLSMKKTIIKIKVNKSQHQKLKEDTEYLMDLTGKKKNNIDSFIDVTLSLNELEEKYNMEQEKFREDLEKEYIRIQNDTYNKS